MRNFPLFINVLCSIRAVNRTEGPKFLFCYLQQQVKTFQKLRSRFSANVNIFFGGFFFSKYDCSSFFYFLSKFFSYRLRVRRVEDMISCSPLSSQFSSISSYILIVSTILFLIFLNFSDFSLLDFTISDRLNDSYCSEVVLSTSD